MYIKNITRDRKKIVKQKHLKKDDYRNIKRKIYRKIERQEESREREKKREKESDVSE